MHTHTLSSARQNGIRFATNFPFCKGTCVWSLDTYFKLSPIYHLYGMFYLYMFICWNVIPRKILSSNIISYKFEFTMLVGFLNCVKFIVHALLPGTSKAFTVSFPAGHTRRHPSAGHTAIFKHLTQWVSYTHLTFIDL